MKKLIATLFLLLLTLPSFATEITVTYDGGWKRILIDTESKEMRIQVWRASLEDFKNKSTLSGVEIVTSEDSIRVYQDDSKKREMGTILRKEEREVEVSTFLYKNKKYLSSEHQNVDLFFDFES